MSKLFKKFVAHFLNNIIKLRFSPKIFPKILNKTVINFNFNLCLFALDKYQFLKEFESNNKY